jgi:microcompartment protein CcmK/EutM
VVEEVIALYRITMTGRESIAGRSTIAFTLDPRPEYKARTKEAGIIKKFKGRAWIDEQDHELARLEMEAIDSVTIGFGVVARLYAGSRAVIERRKVIGDTWLPARSHFVGGGRLLLVKRIDIDQLSEYADYRKPTADTTTTFTFPK